MREHSFDWSIGYDIRDHKTVPVTDIKDTNLTKLFNNYSLVFIFQRPDFFLFYFAKLKSVNRYGI